MKRLTTIIMIAVLSMSMLVAQGRHMDMPGEGQGRGQGQGQGRGKSIGEQPYYQYMVFRMTEELELTAEQAEKLFPLNRPYRDTKHQIHMQMNELSEEIFKKEEITKTDLDKYRKTLRSLQKKELDLDDKFFDEAGTFLAPQQVAKLMFFEPHFRRELSKELKNRYPEKKKDNKKFWEKNNQRSKK